jgi:hypothetical protein
MSFIIICTSRYRNRSYKIPTVCGFKAPFCNARNQVFLLILVNFFTPGSKSAFPIRIREQRISLGRHCANMLDRLLGSKMFLLNIISPEFINIGF